MQQPHRQKHRIGENSSFDVDMDLIEMFVKCKQNADNIVAQTAVVTYYISQLRDPSQLDPQRDL